MMKTAAAFLFFAAIAPIARAETPAFDPQMHDPRVCATGDKQCILNWYKEYKPAIIKEFIDYRELEGVIAGILKSKDDLAAAALTGELVRRKLYKHNHWQFPDPTKAIVAGIDYDDLDVLLSDCRVAIIELKFIIVSARRLPARGVSGPFGA